MPRPCAQRSTSPLDVLGAEAALASMARRTRRLDGAMPRAWQAESSRAMPPQALGAAMDVPFMSWRLLSVHVGTGAMAPPGAETETSSAPSETGPRLLQVYWMSGSALERSEYCGCIIRLDTTAPTAISASHVPGAPPVESAGPLLPADVTKTTLCFSTARVASSTNRPKLSTSAYSPKLMLMRVTPRSMAAPSARTSAVPVSIALSRESPIFRPTSLQPGAMPLSSGRSG